MPQNPCKTKELLPLRTSLRRWEFNTKPAKVATLWESTRKNFKGSSINSIISVVSSPVELSMLLLWHKIWSWLRTTGTTGYLSHHFLIMVRGFVVGEIFVFGLKISQHLKYHATSITMINLYYKKVKSIVLCSLLGHYFTSIIHRLK